MTHYDILPPEQKAVLPQLKPTRRNGFVLYGGTAIALQLGHREPVDFCFISHKKLDEEQLRKSMPLLESAGLVPVLRRSPNSLCRLGFECERANAAQV